MKKWKYLIVIFALLVITGTGFGVNYFVSAKENSGYIEEGVYIETVNVGGMTKEEAEAAVEQYVLELEEKEFVLEAGDKSLTFTADEMGLYVVNEDIVQDAMDIGKTGSLIKRYKDLKDLEQGDMVLALEVAVDRDVVLSLLNNHIDEINTEVVNGSLKRENDEFIYIESATGIAVNVEPSVSLIEEYVQTEWEREDATILLSAEVTEPKGTEEELSKVKDLLGSFGTNYSTSSWARCKNIEVATERINGTVLYPGEEFSVNETILERNKANGYEMAGSYEGGQTVQSYGGGVCQVSTTLYNAVIFAELEVTERKSHSMTVAYVPLARDAAIAEDYLDFKFKNNTEAPIYIEGYIKGKNVYYNIYGEETRPENREVSFESVVLSTQDAGTTFVASEEPVGTVRQLQGRHTGYKTQLYKVVKENGVEVSRELFNSSNYKAAPKQLAIGIATDNETLRMSVYNAVQTQDAATIYSALYGYSPEAAAAVLQ